MRRFLLAVSLLILTRLFSSCAEQAKTFDLDQLLRADQVGADVLPFEIAPVQAPFSTIEFVRPVFKSDTLFIHEGYDITRDVNEAIAELSNRGGGVVVLEPGEWFSGRIELKSNVNFHLREGAVLSFSGEIKDYQPAVYTRIEGIELMSLGACIYANGQNNIAVTGKGRLIGPAHGSVRDKILTHQIIDEAVDFNLPVEERIYNGVDQEWIFPPMFISPINCEQVFIEGLSLENTAFWNVVPIFCDNVIIRGITVHSVGIPRGDGIDIESSSNVLIEYCTLSCGDDCFTMKAGRGQDGLGAGRPTENVVVRYSMALEGHGGITCGSETAGVIRNLYVHDCVFKNTGVGINFKTRRPRGGGGEFLYYERLRMDLKMTAIKWDMLGSPRHVGELAERLPVRDVDELTPFYRDISIKDVLIENATHFMKVNAIPESPLTRIHLNNVQVNSSHLSYLHDVKDLLVENSTIVTPDTTLEVVDGRNIVFKHVTFNTMGASVDLTVEGSESDSIIFENSPGSPPSWFQKSK
jgi:hypothetical protein